MRRRDWGCDSRSGSDLFIVVEVAITVLVAIVAVVVIVTAVVMNVDVMLRARQVPQSAAGDGMRRRGRWRRARY